MRTALPMNRELQSPFLQICAYDNLLHDGAEDHLLEYCRALIVLPCLSEVLAHRQNFRFFLTGQVIALSVKTAQSLFVLSYPFHLSFPPTLPPPPPPPLPAVNT